MFIKKIKSKIHSPHNYWWILPLILSLALFLGWPHYYKYQKNRYRIECFRSSARCDEEQKMEWTMKSLRLNEINDSIPEVECVLFVASLSILLCSVCNKHTRKINGMSKQSGDAQPQQSSKSEKPIQIPDVDEFKKLFIPAFTSSRDGYSHFDRFLEGLKSKEWNKTDLGRIAFLLNSKNVVKDVIAKAEKVFEEESV